MHEKLELSLEMATLQEGQSHIEAEQRKSQSAEKNASNFFEISLKVFAKVHFCSALPVQSLPHSRMRSSTHLNSMRTSNYANENAQQAHTAAQKTNKKTNEHYHHDLTIL